MIISVYLPLLVSLLLAAGSAAVSRLGPARAGAALVAAAATAALTSTWALILLGAALLPETPLISERVAARGGRFLDPVPDVVAVAAVIALTIGIFRVVAVVHRRGVVTRSLRQLCATCGAGGQELVVAPVARPEAFAVPGRWGHPGQILITHGMLRTLDPAQRRALLAHERAHLRCRHHDQRALVEIAAALNPLLIPARDAVAYLVERVADEHAATAVGDRRVTADALAAAALGGRPGSGSPGVLAYSRYGVPRRVAALHAPALPERRLPPMLLILLAGLTAAAAADATLAFARLVHALFPGL